VTAPAPQHSDVRLVAFDLDDTLAPSKSPIESSMATLLVDLLEAVEVCVISGGQFGQFRSQLIDNLPVDPNSDAYITTIGGTRKLHLDLGTQIDQQATDFYGIPWNVMLVYLDVPAARIKQAEEALWNNVLSPLNAMLPEAFEILKPVDLPGFFNVSWTDPNGEYWLNYIEALIQGFNLPGGSGGS
jgi:hypothetical protein